MHAVRREIPVAFLVNLKRTTRIVNGLEVCKFDFESMRSMAVIGLAQILDSP